MKKTICIAIILAVLLVGCGNSDSFDFSKIHFSSSNFNPELNTEQDLLDALEAFKRNELDFLFYCPQGTSLSLFDRMTYSQIYECPDPHFIRLTIQYEDIDLDALKELSQRVEIISIVIAHHLYPTPCAD